MTQLKLKSFRNRLYTILWPIENSELKLFLPMAFLMFCVLFNNSTLHIIKDSLIVPIMGAEVTGFIHLLLILPTAILFTAIYFQLSNLLQMEYIFYLITSSFLLVYILFVYVFYPAQDYYHPSQEFIDALLQNYPHLQWSIRLFGKWSYTLVYIFAELWGVVVINLMFWQFANHIVDTSQARRFYPMFGLIGNMGLILAGNAPLFLDISNYYNSIQDFLGYEIGLETTITLKLMIGTITTSGLIAMYLFHYLNRIALHDKAVKVISKHDIHDTQTKLSLSDSVKLILSSRYIGYIVMIIICYSLAINILEGPWKTKIRELYPTTIEYMAFMSKYNIWMGTCSIIFIVIGSALLRRYSWFVSALITPSIIGITGGMFFIFIIFPEFFSETFSYVALNPIYAAIIVGALQNILSKATKYSLFDSTKEMAYIPLSRELRTKGKAAAEVIGLKFGKSLSAFIQSSIFTIVPMATFNSMSPFLMIIFIVVIIIWVINVQKLNTEYEKLI